MHGRGFERLLNPASLTQEMALKLMGFRLREHSAEKIGGHFRTVPIAGAPSPGRLLWAAELLTQKFWGAFLPVPTWRIEGVKGRFTGLPANEVAMTFLLRAAEREELLQKIRQAGLGALTSVFSLRSPAGLVLGEIEVEMQVRAQRMLGGLSF
jgi:hypothetical protein